ncbi:MAG: hypothetical protein Kow0026_21410 [Oricola sp.]
MFVFLLQAVLLLVIAFVLGAIVGCLLRTQFNAPRGPAPAGRPEPRSAPAETVAPAATEAPPAPAPAAAPKAEAPKKPARSAKPAKPAKSAKQAAISAPAGGKPAAAPDSGTDDLKRIKGIGRQIEAKLNAAGITRYEQIAGWTKADIAAFGEKLAFAGRIEREGWVAQARQLSKGEMTDFARRVARGEVASSKSAPKRGRGKGKP